MQLLIWLIFLNQPPLASSLRGVIEYEHNYSVLRSIFFRFYFWAKLEFKSPKTVGKNAKTIRLGLILTVYTHLSQMETTGFMLFYAKLKNFEYIGILFYEI